MLDMSTRVRYFTSPPLCDARCILLASIFYIFLTTSFAICLLILFYTVDIVLLSAVNTFFFLSTRYCILKVEILGAKRDQLVICLQNVHQGNLRGTLVRFLKAREWSVPKAHKMVRCQTSLQLLHSG